MLRSRLLIAVCSCAFLAAQEPDQADRDRLGRLELEQLQGTWDVASLEEEGQPVPEEELADRTITFGGPIFVIRQGGEVLQFGVLELDPTKKQTTVDAKVLGGKDKDKSMLGIYELDGDTLNVCFDVEGEARPEEFKSSKEPNRFVAVYQRQKPADNETVEIEGRYKALSTAIGSPDTMGEAEISRVGESFMVRYYNGGRVSYVGIGIRTGNILSVCWGNRGEVGISVYHIEEGPKLTGHYSKLGGVGVLNREELTPLPIID